MGRSLEQTECVVGALCLSAFTDPTRSEYIGMGAAFLFAGVKTYIGSLWSVQDIGTAELIKKTYDNRFHQRLNWAESLRKAQLTMCGKFRVAPSGAINPGEIALEGATLNNATTDGQRQPAIGIPIDVKKYDSTHPYFWAGFTVSGS
jgi:CHAT domain-containing protein